MKVIVYAIVLSYALYAVTALGQGYTTLPNGQQVFTPQPRDYQTPQYFSPQGGPPVGYGVRSGDVELFVPYRGGPSYVIQDDQ